MVKTTTNQPHSVKCRKAALASIHPNPQNGNLGKMAVIRPSICLLPFWEQAKSVGQSGQLKKPDELTGRDSQIFACQLARSKSAEGCGSPAATSKGHRPFEAPTEPTGETSSLQGSRVKPLPSDMMLCVISYWVLSGAKRRQIQQLRCCVFPRQAVETEECLSEINTTQRTSRSTRHLQPVVSC